MSSRPCAPAPIQLPPAPSDPGPFWRYVDERLAQFIETFIARGHHCLPPARDGYASTGASHSAAGLCEAYVCPECQQVWLKAQNTA